MHLTLFKINLASKVASIKYSKSAFAKFNHYCKEKKSVKVKHLTN